MSVAARPAIPVILNPSARNGAVQERVAPLRAALAAKGHESVVTESQSDTHASELAAAHARDGAKVVVSLGGDGMVRAVAAGLVGTQSALGIVAGGRGNDFIGKLGIPKDIEEAAAIVVNGADRTIDVLDLDGRICVGNVSLGLDGTVHEFADSARRIKGHWVYTYGVARAIMRPRRTRLVLTIDGTKRDFVGYSAGFANSGRYGGGLKLSPTAEVDDGLIDVVLLGDVPLLRLAAQLVAFNIGKPHRHPDITFERAREVAITSPDGAPPVKVFADGDLVGQTPTTVRIRPGALKVRVPAL